MSDVTVRDIEEAARSCVGTPFQHQGRWPGVGLDCVGLVRYPAVATGLYPPDWDFTNYGPEPLPIKMRNVLERYFDPVAYGSGSAAHIRPGDVVWFMVVNDPQHLGIYTKQRTMIHSALKKGVVEHGFRSPWPSRVRGVLRYKGLG